MTDTAAFTPGPWRWLRQPYHRLVGSADGRDVLVPAARGSHIVVAGSPADLALIAAAPEMYEALRGLIAVHVRIGDADRFSVDAARAAIAIAKADGR